MNKKPTELDTIAAIATPPGRGGIGVVRISGPKSSSIARAILGHIPKPRYASYGPFLAEDGAWIDQGIALYFNQPHSFTGEEVVELQRHGGPAVMQMLLARCLSLGARLAGPGEFSQRAFLNGKIDLTQAEAIADLIESNSAQAARCALRSLQGEFSKSIHRICDKLTELRAYTEATLDFPEEEIEAAGREWQKAGVLALINEIDSLEHKAQQGSILREGATIALLGRPNVGKSSLLNQLAEEDVALVSEIAGTTRDTIQQKIILEGVPIHIIDTAGLRETSDIVEKMGVERTKQTARKADLLLLLIDAKDGLEKQHIDEIKMLSPGTQLLIVANKIDLSGDRAREEKIEDNTILYVSVKTGEGLHLLKNAILQHIGWHAEGGIFMARARHIAALAKAKEHLERASNSDLSEELLAEELRLSQESLNSITGEFTADDLLGEIFSRFCIGK